MNRWKISRSVMIIVVLLVISITTACGSDKDNKEEEAAGASSSSNAAQAKSEQASSNADSDQTDKTAAVDELAVPDLSKVTLVIGQTGWNNLEQGFKAAGVDNTPYKVEYQVFQGGNLQLEAMAAGHLDLALTSEIPPIFAAGSSNGGNFKIIALSNSNTLLQEVVIPKDSSIKSVADLKGKKVAYVKATTAQYFLLKILNEAGLSWQDIEPVDLSTSDGLSALIGGKVDALASYGNAIITAHQRGATTLASAKEILSGNFPIETTPNNLADPSKKAAILDYLGRINQFYDWTRGNQKKWADITAAATKQDPAQALDTLQQGEAQRPTRIISATPEAIASQQDVADTLQSIGLLPSKLDVSTIWSDELNGKF